MRLRKSRDSQMGCWLRYTTKSSLYRVQFCAGVIFKVNKEQVRIISNKVTEEKVVLNKDKVTNGW